MTGARCDDEEEENIMTGQGGCFCCLETPDAPDVRCNCSPTRCRECGSCSTHCTCPRDGEGMRASFAEWGDDGLAQACRALAQFSIARGDGHNGAAWLRIAHYVERHPDLVGAAIRRQVSEAVADLAVSGAA